MARRCCLSRAVCAGLLAAVFFVSPLAFAQPSTSAGSAAETAEARAQLSFEQGLSFQHLGQLEAACELFEASAEVAPLPHALLQVGNCRERLDPVGALGSFEAALAAAARVEEAVQREAYEAAARQRIERLGPRVPTLTFRSSPTPGASVVVASTSGSASASSDVAVTRFDQPQRFNPGSYGVRVSAPDRALYITNVDLAAGQHLEIVLPALEELPSVGSPPVRPRVRTGAGAGPVGEDAQGFRFRPLPVALASGGAALVLTSVVTGLVSSSARYELERECGGPSAVTGLRPCGESLAGAKSRMEDYALATDVLWVTGAVLAGVGVTLFVLDQSEPETGWLEAACSAESCALTARGQF